tara:strand:- start:531 stop:803 length:273 start_codon:yes stop_codon:yes gene_type:complete
MNHLELEYMATSKPLPEERKAILEKIWKLHQRVQGWISRNTGKASPNEMNVAQAVLRELEEYTAAISIDHDYRLSKQDMQNVNAYWKAYR